MHNHPEQEDLEQQAKELAEMLDALVASGSQHIHLHAGEETDAIRVQTVNSTDCSGILGACAIPNAADDDDDF